MPWFLAWNTWFSFLYMGLLVRISIGPLTLEQTFSSPPPSFFVPIYLSIWLYLCTSVPTDSYLSIVFMCGVLGEPAWTTGKASLWDRVSPRILAFLMGKGEMYCPGTNLPKNNTTCHFLSAYEVPSTLQVVLSTSLLTQKRVVHRWENQKLKEIM